MRRTLVESLWFFTTSDLTFSTMSVTSSTTPGQRGELVLRAVNLDLRDGAAFEAGQQNAAQAVADRHAEAALERLGDELAVGRASASPRRKPPGWAVPSPRHRICMSRSPLKVRRLSGSAHQVGAS